MDRFPETSITEKVFFQNPGDLESYTNGMYGYLGCLYWDAVSDNMLYKESKYLRIAAVPARLKLGAFGLGEISAKVNFMLARTGNVKGDKAEINHYIGLARMFRAKLYYDKVKSYSDVPWYSTDLQTTDTEELYKTQESLRKLVVDSIMAVDSGLCRKKT